MTAKAIPFPASSENFRPALTPRQEIALRALVEGRSTRAAAKAAHVTERTVYTWRNEPGFASALQAARDSAFASALDGLRLGFAEAIASARASLKSHDGRERTSAQRALLRAGLNAHEALDVERRIAALEARPK